MGKHTVRTIGYSARAASRISLDIAQEMNDAVEITGNEIKIAVIQDDVKIPRKVYEAYIENDVPISNDLALDMMKNNLAAIDKLIYQGWTGDGTTYDIKGMYQIGGTATTGADFATFGNGYISIAAAITDLNAAGVFSDSYNVILNSVQYGQLLGSISPTGGNTEMDKVKELLGPDGRVLQNSNVTAATGIVAPDAADINRQYFDIVETLAPMHHAWFVDGNERTGDVRVQQITMLAPRFKHIVSTTDVAVDKLTGI
jgi:hypothetical protein